jgi:hypothetical protein
VVTDKRMPDNPIVYCSDEFEGLTLVTARVLVRLGSRIRIYAFNQYSREEILDRNCRFLQGELTDRTTVKFVRDGLIAEKQFDVEVSDRECAQQPTWKARSYSTIARMEFLSGESTKQDRHC